MKLIDNENNTFYEGSKEQCLELHKIMYKNPEDVTEDDEVKFEQYLRKQFVGDLRMQLDLEFVTVDDWNRPIFKSLDYNVYIASLDTLFEWSDSSDVIKEHFREHPDKLTIFGSSYDCDPLGAPIGTKFKVNIL